MTTTVKPLALKNIGNVPDWVKQRGKDKKDSLVPQKKDAGGLKPLRRAAPKPKPSTATITVTPTAPAFAKPPVIPQPITEEVKDPIEHGVLAPPTGAKVRRIYSREFLIKFKYSTTPFPPGVLTPQDIIAQYNKDFEVKERSAQESSSISVKPTVSFASATLASVQSHQATESEAPRANITAEKKIKRKAEGDKVFKLRGMGSDDTILHSPLFRSNKSGPKHTSSASSSDDKENPVSASKPVKSSLLSVKRRAASPLVTKCEAANTHTLPTTPSPAIPTAVPTAPATPAPVTSCTPVAESMEIADSKPAVEADAKQDAVDALTKKLKSVMKETDPRRLAQRQKQIEYGKATLGYKDYTKEVAKSKRKREDPKTPNKYQVCSKRSWDGQIRKWRRMLHFYDPADLQGTPDADMDGDAAKPDFTVTAEDILAEENALKE